MMRMMMMMIIMMDSLVIFRMQRRRCEKCYWTIMIVFGRLTNMSIFSTQHVGNGEMSGIGVFNDLK